MNRLLIATLMTTACTTIPRGQSAVDRVDFVGNHDVSGDDIEAKIATTDTPKFLYLFRGVVYDYALYDRHVLAYDLARIERYYRARGYYDAHARAARVLQQGDQHVRVEIVVDEGKPVKVRDVHIRVDGSLLASEDARMRRDERGVLGQGARLDEDELAKAEKAIRRVLEDDGYAKVTVTSHADVDLATHAAIVTFDVRPAEKCVFGELRVEGLGTLPEHATRRTINLVRGEPYSRKALEQAQRRLLEQGVVSSVAIEPDLAHASPGVVPIVAHLEPSKLREIQLGGGFEIDVLKTDMHVKAGWSDRNFLGDFRHFTASVSPGLVLYPLRLSYFQPPNELLPEEKSSVELRQPGFIEALTEGFVKPEINTYPVLVSETYVPDAPVLGYFEMKSTQGVTRSFGKLKATLSHTLQVEVPFTYSGPLDPTLTTLVISYVELQTILDLRNDAIHPRSGLYLGNDFQVAGLGGQPQDIRVQPEVRAYVPLGKRVTLAARATVGFVFPNNYQAGTDTRDVQIVFFRGFFSGGPTENRGYPLRGIGPFGESTLYNPLVNKCMPGQPADVCAVPLGGLSLWEASLEARIAIGGPFSGVVFCDTADVSAAVFTLHFDRPHLSCGVGARYDTPIGALRADVGYRIPGAQVFTGALEPTPTILGLPIAIQLGLGEAF